MGCVAIGPDLTDSQLLGSEAFHQKREVHFAHAVGIFISKRQRSRQLHQQGHFLAGEQGTQTDIRIQRACGQGSRTIQRSRRTAQTGSGALIQQLFPVIHTHGQLIEEVGHGSDGLAAVISQIVGFLIMGNKLHVEVDIIAVLCLIDKGNRFKSAVPGHDTLEAAEQIGIGIVNTVPIAVNLGGRIQAAVHHLRVGKAGQHTGAQHGRNGHKNSQEFQELSHAPPPALANASCAEVAPMPSA